MLNCFSCFKEIQIINNKVSYREECLACHADVHVCKNCEFYDLSAYNECRESSADRVVEKDRANYCDYFSVSMKGKGPNNQKDTLKAAAEALFKKN